MTARGLWHAIWLCQPDADGIAVNMIKNNQFLEEICIRGFSKDKWTEWWSDCLAQTSFNNIALQIGEFSHPRGCLSYPSPFPLQHTTHPRVSISKLSIQNFFCTWCMLMSLYWEIFIIFILWNSKIYYKTTPWIF